MAGVVSLPETTLKKLNARILPQWKVCFFAGLLVGLLAHFYKLTNWLPNWDGLVFRYDPQNMIALGRWFLPVVCSFSSFYDLPFLNGLVAIVFHALSAVCICRFLNVQSKITACLIGAVIVSFPAVTSVMMYNYVADGYSIACFLSTLAALFMTKGKAGYYALAAVLIALSMGIYQAYITVTIMLILLKLIDELLYHRANLGSVLKQSVFMLLTGILGAVLYTVVLNGLLAAFSVTLLDYQGIGSSASLAAMDLRGSLYTVKETFLHCFFDLSGGVNLYVALNAFLLLATAACALRHSIQTKLYKKPVTLAAIPVLCVLLVIGAGALAFVNASVDYHNLMRMGYAAFYLFFLILYERGADTNVKLVCARRWIVLLSALLLIANQVVIANVSYHKAQMAYEKSYGVLMRIADRIEQTPETAGCDKLLVLGALDNSEVYSVNLTPDITGITDGYIIRADDESVNQSILCSALADYCELDYTFLSGAEKQQFAQRPEVQSMPVWPAAGCIAAMDDTLVIKLGSEGEM